MVEREPQPGIDALCAALGHRYRRDVLRYLRENGGRATTTELAASIAADESVRDVRTALRHAHLPKLETNDAVDYWPENGTVVLSSRAEWFLSTLDSIERQARPA